MRGFISGLSSLTFSFYALAKSDIVQGPLKLDANSSINIKKEGGVNYPLALYLDSNGNSSKVESYAVDGSEPHVETVFLLKKSNCINLLRATALCGKDKWNCVSGL